MHCYSGTVQTRLSKNIIVDYNIYNNAAMNVFTLFLLGEAFDGFIFNCQLHFFYQERINNNF